MAIGYIVGAAAFCAPFSPTEQDVVVAADGGFRHVRERGITPTLIIGDFDSLASQPVGNNVMTFPVEKDDTDTMLAVKILWERGVRDFRLLAGVGGRGDHTVANLQTLLWVARRGGHAVLCGDGECFAVLKDGKAQFVPKAEGTLSVFAMGGDAHDVTLQGVYYPLEHGDLATDFPLGVSNHFVGQSATVQVGDGTLLMYWTGTADEVTFHE